MARGVNILALVTDAFGGYGGIAQYNRDFLCALADSTIVERVTVLPRLAHKHNIQPPVKIFQLPPRQGRLSYSANALATAHCNGPFDVVFCGHIYQAPLAAFLCRNAGARLWLQAHGIEAWDRPGSSKRAAIERADLVTSVSRYTRRRMLEWTNLAAERIRVLPNTVRPEFSPGPRDEATLRKLGLSGRKLILTVSRIAKSEAYKGHDRVIEAMATVTQVEQSALYVIVGDGDWRAELKALAERRGVSESVRFLGRLSDEDILALYRSADVFIMPSEREGFGIVFLEAAACRLPIIAGNRDGAADALADGVIGRLIDPLSIQEIAGALTEILSQKPTAALEGVERFDYSHFAAHVDTLIRTLAT